MRWPKRPIRADRRRGHRREETLRVAARSVLACIATLHPLTVPGTAQEAPTPIPGQLVVLGADGEPVAGAVVQGRLFDGLGAEPVAGGGGDEDSTVQAEFLAVPGLYRLDVVDGAGRRWGAEVNVSSRGPAEEPVVVNGREAGL